ncbi:hypothetical protein GH714_037707 [Hevea brasiliensis]|uniref:R13L1/DRL21-like LRR repeat region domain-containing protein n=1 Tax=Hevea brasiliensis TaxID=3981 RepID=A0A6A6L4W2_HEVBR|nr:hypothetical protein GH714_037707 [Hevea brasiliensis]
MKIPSDGDSSRVFDNLVELMLRNCKWCEQLPMLGHLPRLKALWISGMDKIRSIGNEFYGIGDGSTSNGVRPFPALKVLGFSSMKSLLEWKAAPVDGRQIAPRGVALSGPRFRSPGIDICSPDEELRIGDFSEKLDSLPFFSPLGGVDTEQALFVNSQDRATEMIADTKSLTQFDKRAPPRSLIVGYYEKLYPELRCSR